MIMEQVIFSKRSTASKLKKGLQWRSWGLNCQQKKKSTSRTISIWKKKWGVFLIRFNPNSTDWIKRGSRCRIRQRRTNSFQTSSSRRSAPRNPIISTRCCRARSWSIRRSNLIYDSINIKHIYSIVWIKHMTEFKNGSADSLLVPNFASSVNLNSKKELV